MLNASIMTHGSLFSGIGGAELAASWMGWNNLFHCEIDPFCQRILNYWFPESKSYGDITKTDFRQWRGKVDVLTGGFPCQPFSLAGKRQGTTDNRYLWPEMLRAIREIQPAWVVGENVGGIVSMVQPGTEIEMGCEASLFEEDYYTEEEQTYVIETICEDFEDEGYSVQPILIPACAVGAPHRRDRIWFIANRANTRNKSKCEREKLSNKYENITNTASKQSKRMQFEQQEFGKQEQRKFRGIYCENGNIHNWDNFPTQSPVCGRNDGLSDRLDGITFPKWGKESIKAYGNSWVPQVAYEIFSVIDKLNKINNYGCE